MEYRVRTAREHGKKYGRGSAVPLSKSPRMRVNYAQLDHFLEFITSPHVVTDLPFGQRLLSLADGSLLETPNLIRTMIPERKGKCEPSEKPEHVEGEQDTDESVDEEAEEDGEGADASSLLSCPVEGCIRSYQRYHNLERHLLIS